MKPRWFKTHHIICLTLSCTAASGTRSVVFTGDVIAALHITNWIMTKAYWKGKPKVFQCKSNRIFPNGRVSYLISHQKSVSIKSNKYKTECRKIHKQAATAVKVQATKHNICDKHDFYISDCRRFSSQYETFYIKICFCPIIYEHLKMA